MGDDKICRIVIDELGFQKLVEGEVLSAGPIEVALADIGSDRMYEIVESVFADENATPREMGWVDDRGRP